MPDAQRREVVEGADFGGICGALGDVVVGARPRRHELDQQNDRRDEPTLESGTTTMSV